ncbi:MAG: Hsp20/alpha crystallin family protein [Alicyclobacillaceae bacterium]|nr:Hsp20/alpha crystallin family protein [Alicyclobacillaceae bacterium]
MRHLPDWFRKDRDLGNLFAFPSFPSLPAFFDRTFAVDVKDAGETLEIEAEIPGVNREQIEVEVTDSGVTIAVKVEEETEEKRERYYRKERSYGRSERFIAFPVEVDAEAGKATYRNGILHLSFPKKHREGERKKKLSID